MVEATSGPAAAPHPQSHHHGLGCPLYQMGIAGQLRQGGRGRQVAPVILPLLGLGTCRARSQQPADLSLVTRQQRTATPVLRRQPLVPCRQQIVRPGRRGRACNS
jgi:hypothetical protein